MALNRFTREQHKAMQLAILKRDAENLIRHCQLILSDLHSGVTPAIGIVKFALAVDSSMAILNILEMMEEDEKVDSV